MDRRRRVVLASGNPGKLREFAALLAPLGLALESQAALGIESPPETGTTFVANALLKARHAAQVSGLPALADDSGLEVDALGGAPGVHSARYASPDLNTGNATDADNLRKLIDSMSSVPPAHRGARFRCAIAFVRAADDTRPLVAEGSWEGRLASAPRGQGGFGYDPLFEDAASGLTAAELPAEIKNTRSHRARALDALVVQLRAALDPPRSGRDP
jgi:XTP/dITP diphosphohydrolase